MRAVIAWCILVLASCAPAEPEAPNSPASGYGAYSPPEALRYRYASRGYLMGPGGVQLGTTTVGASFLGPLAQKEMGLRPVERPRHLVTSRSDTFHIVDPPEALWLDTPGGPRRALHSLLWGVPYGYADAQTVRVERAGEWEPATYWMELYGMGGEIWDFCTGDTSPDLNGDGFDDFGVTTSAYIQGIDVTIWLSRGDGGFAAQRTVLNPCLERSGVLDSRATFKGNGWSHKRFTAGRDSLTQVYSAHYHAREDTLTASGDPMLTMRIDGMSEASIRFEDLPSRDRWITEHDPERVVEYWRGRAVYFIQLECENLPRYAYVHAKPIRGLRTPAHLQSRRALCQREAPRVATAE